MVVVRHGGIPQECVLGPSVSLHPFTYILFSVYLSLYLHIIYLNSLQILFLCTQILNGKQKTEF